MSCSEVLRGVWTCVCVVPCCPIQAEFSCLVSSVVMVGCRSTKTLTSVVTEPCSAEKIENDQNGCTKIFVTKKSFFLLSGLKRLWFLIILCMEKIKQYIWWPCLSGGITYCIMSPGSYSLSPSGWDKDTCHNVFDIWGQAESNNTASETLVVQTNPGILLVQLS